MKFYSMIAVAAFAGLMLGSCSKKYTCSHSVHYYPPLVIFKGFSKDDLKKVVVNTYNPNGSFENRLSTDTFDYSNAAFLGDTAYVKDGNFTKGFYQVNVGKDYELFVLSTNQGFRISNVQEGDPVYIWTQDDHCSSGASQPENRPCSLKLNDQPASVIYGFGGFAICLAH